MVNGFRKGGSNKQRKMLIDTNSSSWRLWVARTQIACLCLLHGKGGLGGLELERVEVILLKELTTLEVFLSRKAGM